MTRSDIRWPFPRLWAFVLGRYTLSRQVALLWVLATAVEKQMPLAPLVDAFVDDTRGPWRLRARDLARMLHGGTPLPAALDTLPGVLPRSVALAAHVGSQSGTLAAALRTEASSLMERQELAIFSVRGFVALYISVFWVLLSIAGFLMFYIIPKFKAIFSDFGMPLPPATVAFLEVSDLVVEYSFVLLPVLLLSIWVVVFFSRGQMFAVGGLASRFVLRISIPGILRNIGVAVAAGRPLTTALSTLAAFHPVPSVRRRLLLVDRQVEQGADCWLAMQQVGLLRGRQVALLQAAQRAGNLPWALHLLADNLHKYFQHRFHMAVELLRPVLVLCVGAAVGFVVLALFYPLLSLIHSLS